MESSGVAARPGDASCPCAAMQAVWESMSRDRREGDDGPIFVDEEGAALSAECVGAWVEGCWERVRGEQDAGLRFSRKSMRGGFSSTVRTAGIDPAISDRIMRLRSQDGARPRTAQEAYTFIIADRALRAVAEALVRQADEEAARGGGRGEGGGEGVWAE